MAKPQNITVELPLSHLPRYESAQLIRSSGIYDLIAQSATGPFGHTAKTLAAMEGLAHAIDLATAGAAELRGLLMAETAKGSFAMPSLSAPQRQFVGAFFVVLLADALDRTLRGICGVAPTKGGLSPDGLLALLESEVERGSLARKALALAVAFFRVEGKNEVPPSEDAGEDALRKLGAFFSLLRAAVLTLCRASELRALVAALETRKVAVQGHSYRGLTIQETSEDASGLLPVSPDQIVGNDAYLQAGLRLARDIAGYDVELRRNPKKVNPVLFGLGRPGCGKTVTAHAIGNYFLDFCRDRGVPARFRVIRRTDWASSYQNASALNLVSLFRDEIGAFPGVSGVYWPDIDTAFASRAAQDLRMEEKQTLGAVFGVFDGTLLPKDGKWFLICDANTMHMDEATVSRIAQNPFSVGGPQAPEDYITLMRDILLKDIEEYLPPDQQEWEQIGDAARRMDLSGRNIEALCGNIRSLVQDFEYPDAYYQACPKERAAILKGLGNNVTEQCIQSKMEELADFHRDAEQRAEEEQFEQEVSAIVRRLNASREAEQRAFGLKEQDSSR